MKKLLWLSMLSVLAMSNVNAEKLASNGGNVACGIVPGEIIEVPATVYECAACPRCEKYEFTPEQVKVIPAQLIPEQVEVVPASMRSVCPIEHVRRCHTRCHSCQKSHKACNTCHARVQRAHEARARGEQVEIIEGVEVR